MLTEMNTASVGALIAEERKNHNQEFRVTMKTGETKNMRLFVGTTGQIGYHPPRTRRNGYLLHLEYVQSIEPVRHKQTPVEERFRTHAKKLADILTASGLWGNILAALKECDFDYEKAQHHPNLYSELVIHIADWKVKKMDFRDKYQCRMFNTCNEEYYAQISEHYEREENFTIPRKEGRSYDISFEFKKGEDGIRRAWYSEEYRNCGNGHYYLAIDNERAIYYEKD